MYNGRINEYNAAFRQLKNEIKFMPGNIGCFIANSDGEILYKNALERYRNCVSFACVPLYVEEKDRVRCLKNLSVGKTEIYKSRFFDDEYITLQPYKNGMIRGVPSCISERNCKMIQEYAQKLKSNTELFYRLMNKRTNKKADSHPVICMFEDKLAGANELIKYSKKSSSKNHEADGVVNIGVLLNRISSFSKICDCNIIHKTVGSYNRDDVCSFMPASFSNLMVYALGFLINNSSDRNVYIKTKKTAMQMQIEFFTMTARSKSYKMYRTVLTDAMERYSVDSVLSKKKNNTSFEVKLPLCTDNELVFKQSKKTQKSIYYRLSKPQTKAAFRLISGI